MSGASETLFGGWSPAREARGKTRARRLSPGILALILCCAAVEAAPAEGLAAAGFSAMPLFPPTLGLASYPEAGASLLAPGGLRVTTSLTWANTLRVEDGFRLPGYLLTIDAETLSARQALGIGLLPGLELEGWVEGSALFGGALDRPLSFFHHLFGFANQWRDSVPPGQLLIDIHTPGGDLPELKEATAGLQAAGLGLRYSPFPTLPLAAGLWVKLPPRFGLPLPLVPEVSWGLSLGSECRLWEFTGAIGAGLAWERASALRSFVPARSPLLQGRARLFYQPLVWLVLGIEAAGSASPYDTNERYLGGTAGNLWLGGKIRVSEDWILELALVEELASWASVEVGFQIGASWSGPR